jgi:hypothetical protein
MNGGSSQLTLIQLYTNSGLAGLGLSDEERGMVQLFDPSACSTADGSEAGVDTTGFFCAKFLKVESVFGPDGGGDGGDGASGEGEGVRVGVVGGGEGQQQ